VIIDPAGVTRILLIKLRGVGDVLLSTIVIRNIRLAFPNARIDFLTEPVARDVLTGNNDLNAVVLFDRNTMSGADLIRKVRGNRYDLIIDLFGNPRTALVTRWSGARYRVGYRFRWRSYAYNILTEPRGGAVHNTQFNLDALERLGIAIQDRNLYFPLSPEDEAFADRVFEERGLKGVPVVGLSFSGGWYTKRWGRDHFAELACRIVSRFGCRVMVVWGPGEEDDASGVVRAIGAGGLPAPPTTLKQLAALLKRCACFVSNDSGPMHIATAVGTPVLGIYGPTNPNLQGPYGPGHRIVRNEELECLGCNLTACPIGHPCMKELSVESVEEAFGMLYEKRHHRS